MSYFRPIFLVAGNTITGILRGIVLNVLLVMAALFIIASTSTSTFQESEMRRMMVDSGLAGITMLGAIIAILTGFTMLPGEVESRTAYPVLAKPVRRWQFVLGKFIGAAGVNGITVALLSLLFFVVYYLKMHEFDQRLLPAVLMILATLVTLSALIIFFSTFMSWIGTIIVSMVIWFLGSYSEFLFDLAQHHETSGLSSKLFSVVHILIPNFQSMDLRYLIVTEEIVSFKGADILLPLGSAGLFVVITLALAILIFNYREM
ncbi:MAG: ABC transporter permease [Armatimonadota bacterium]